MELSRVTIERIDTTLAPAYNGTVENRVRIRLEPVAKLANQLSNDARQRFRVFEAAHVETAPDSSSSIGEPIYSPVLNPPVLRWGSEIVWGFALIEALSGGSTAASAANSAPAANSASSLADFTETNSDPDDITDAALAIPVADLDGVSPFEVLETVLRQEGRPDRFSFPEMDRLESLMQDLEIPLQQQQQLDSLVQRKGSFRSNLKRYRELPERLQPAVAGGVLDVRTATAVRDLASPAADRVMRANLGFSMRRIVLTRLLEIQKRDRLDSEQVDELAEDIINADDPAAAVNRIRYPEYTRRQRAIAEMQQRDFGKIRLSLQLPENLEGDTITITCQVRSAEELHQQRAALATLQERIDEYLSLL